MTVAWFRSDDLCVNLIVPAAWDRYTDNAKLPRTARFERQAEGTCPDERGLARVRPSSGPHVRRHAAQIVPCKSLLTDAARPGAYT